MILGCDGINGLHSKEIYIKIDSLSNDNVNNIFLRNAITRILIHYSPQRDQTLCFL